jgi:uncharacterized Fe-S cluster-containing radical SAM superfamily protein
LPVDTEKASNLYRAKTLDESSQRILMTRLRGSEQEVDLHDPVNCSGLGRVRHFRRATSPGWPSNPLPIDPAANALGLSPGLAQIEAEVFQNAACNWRCWYCFVPFNLLSADLRYSEMTSMETLVQQYADLDGRPRVLDLSGGQPDITPEYVLWTMRALQSHGLVDSTFLWSDDNLSNDFFWSKLNSDEQREIAAYKNYAKVGCFKGFDKASFAFNTMAPEDGFDRQFEIMSRSIKSGLDMYAYATFTSPVADDLPGKMEAFIDSLQEVHPLLPLRTVPLEVQVFTPTSGRIRPEHLVALEVQKAAISQWTRQIEKRFTLEQRSASICDSRLADRRAS